MNKMIETLKGEGSESYIKLQNIKSFGNVKKTVIVPTDSRLFIPMDGMDGKKVIED